MKSNKIKNPTSIFQRVSAENIFKQNSVGVCEYPRENCHFPVQKKTQTGHFENDYIN